MMTDQTWNLLQLQKHFRLSLQTVAVGDAEVLGQKYAAAAQTEHRRTRFSNARLGST